MSQGGLFGLSEHLKRLSAHGDPQEVLGWVVDFEAFRPTLDAALAYSDGAKGGRRPYDPVTRLKGLVLAAQNNVSDAARFDGRILRDIVTSTTLAGLWILGFLFDWIGDS